MSVEINDDELLFGGAAEKSGLGGSSDFEPIPDGTYEFEIEEIAKAQSKKTGKEMMKFRLRVRDIDQNALARKRCVWYTITKKDGDKAFNFYWLNKIIVSQKDTEGYRENFKNGLDEVIQWLIGRHVMAEVEIIEPDGGTPFNSVKGDTFVKSRYDDLHKNAVKANQEVVKDNIDDLEFDDEIPF